MLSPIRPSHVTLLALLAAGCSADRSPADPLTESGAAANRRHLAGFVATASNASAGNTIMVFPQSADGSLGDPQAFPTGGAGTSGGLGNQGGLALSQDRRFLLAVNAGSNDVSVFRTGGGQLSLVGVTPSGGTQPVSVTVRNGLVYVLNAGGSGGVTGFRLSDAGDLTPIAGSARPLSSGATAPAQVGLSPDGRWLVVTERATNLIGLYRVRDNGLLGDYVAVASAGATPFGFSFDRRGGLFVSEAFGGAPDASALSSYLLNRSLSLTVRTASAGTTETAACWVELTPNGRFAYVTNTASGTVSGYRIGSDGSVSLLDADGVTGMTGAGPIDLTISPDGRRLYTLNGAGGTLSGFVVRGDGSLERLAAVSPAVPGGANGLVSW
jgi:6-phosphogluconolactonase (cycloisomerase 2 family)